MEERKDGMTESQADGSGMADFLIEKQVTPDLFLAFWKQVGSKHRNEDGQSDVFRVITTPHPIIKALTTSTSLRTTFAPGPEISQIRCVLAGKVRVLNLGGTPEELRAFADKLTARNAALGLIVPEAKEGAVAVPGSAGTFTIAAGFVPMHKLSERNRAGLPLFPEASRTFHALRTPLNWAAGLALFRFTSPDRPGDWQEVTINALTDQVYCLTDRNAPRRGDHAPDVLGEVVKLFAETIAVVTPRTEKCGHIYKSWVDLRFFRVIAELGLSYLDTKTGRLVRPDDPSLPRAAIVPLTVKGRRVYTPDGKDIKALTGDRWKLELIRWRWSPTIVDDLLASPVLDKKGNVIRDKAGKVIRGGFNIKVIIRIFDALFRLRSEKAYVAHDLLVLLAMDIYKPPKQAAAPRNVVVREAGRLFDLLGLEYDPKHKGRREEAVAAAIFRLKQPDIGALLPGSDESPRPPSEADLRGTRRKGPYYRLVRSALYTPPGILTKAEVAAIEADYEAAPEPPALPNPETRVDQAVLPGIIRDAQPIPSGSDIREAREAAGMNLRDFANMIQGPKYVTWSNYENGKAIRVGKISPDVWERVREFITQHGKKEG